VGHTLTILGRIVPHSVYLLGVYAGNLSPDLQLITFPSEFNFYEKTLIQEIRQERRSLAEQ